MHPCAPLCYDHGTSIGRHTMACQGILPGGPVRRSRLSADLLRNWVHPSGIGARGVRTRRRGPGL